MNTLSNYKHNAFDYRTICIVLIAYSRATLFVFKEISIKHFPGQISREYRQQY